VSEAPADVLLAGANLEAPQELSLPFGVGVVYTAASPDRKQDDADGDDPNQDALAVVCGPDMVLLAGADGLGGHRGGHEASKLLVSELHKAASDTEAGDIRAAVLGTIERVNEVLGQDRAGGAATVIVVEITREGMRPYHVGDAGALVAGQRGRLKLRTVDHTPVGYAVAAGLLDEDDALHHDERHVVDNAVGGDNMRVELGSRLALAARDTIVLGSDGLFDNLTIDELVDLVRTGPLMDAARRVVAVCRARMTEPTDDAPSKLDDLSFILYRPE
jgi:serine/threonine protein phosphatase PrpC